MNEELKKVIAGRTLESIKGQRKAKSYREQVRRYLEAPEPVAESCEAAEPVAHDSPEHHDHETPEGSEPSVDETPMEGSDSDYDRNLINHLKDLPASQSPQGMKWHEDLLDRVIDAIPSEGPADRVAIQRGLDEYAEVARARRRAQRARKIPEPARNAGRDEEDRVGQRSETSRKEKRRKKRATYKRVQTLWKVDRRKCAKIILSGEWETEDGERGDEPSLEQQEAFWSGLYSTPSQPDQRPVASVPEERRMAEPISGDEIKKRVKKLNTASASGPDNLTVPMIRKIPVTCLGKLFNLMILARYIPKAFRHSRTVLIPKVQKPVQPSQYRPISITSILLRTFTGILAGRSQEYCRINPCQRAFQPVDGCAENIMILDNIISRAKDGEHPLAMALIDVAKAFDTVSHDTIMRAYRRLGAPTPVVETVESMYLEATTEIRRDTHVRLRRGVRQGDPLSPFLFNAVIDEVVDEALKEECDKDYGGTLPPILAFADDLVVLARTPAMLRDRLERVEVQMNAAGLRINGAKCNSLTIGWDGRNHRSFVNAKERYEMGGEVMRALGPADTVKYLGVEVGYFGTQFTAELALVKGIDNIRKSPLKPQQKLAILKQFLVPKLLHSMVLSASKRKDMVAADLKIRRAVRDWLHLPMDTPIPYFYASIKDGGLGLMELRASIPVMKRSRLEELRRSSHPYKERFIDSARWVKFLMRSQLVIRNGVTLDTKAKVVESHKRSLYATVDGAGLEFSSEVPVANVWRDEGTSLMTGGAFVAAVKIHGNLVATRHRATRGKSRAGGDRYCDAGCRKPETLAHISQKCMRTWAPRIERHDRIVKYVMVRLKECGWSVKKEVHIPFKGTYKKPDIVAKKGADVFVTDVTVTADNHHPDEAHDNKVELYDIKEIRDHLKKEAEEGQEPVFKFSAVALSWRGVWSLKSATDLQWAGLKKHDLKIITVRALEGGKRIVSWHRKSTEGCGRRGGASMMG